MLRLVFLLAVLAVVLASPRRSSGKRSPGISQLHHADPIRGFAMRNGKKLSLYPYVVEIETANMGHLCGGALIRANVVITASHCFNKTTINNVVVRAGHVYRRDETAQTRLVTEIVMYNDTDIIRYYDDIALLRLDRPFTLGPFINIVALPTSPYSKNMYADEVATLFGWGLTENNQISDELRRIDLKVLRKKKCEEYTIRDSANVICGSDANNQRAVSCGGDSGGPLVSLGMNPPITSLLIGVHTYSFNNKTTNVTCDYQQPSVNMNIAYYLDWVTETLNELN